MESIRKRTCDVDSDVMMNVVSLLLIGDRSVDTAIVAIEWQIG